MALYFSKALRVFVETASFVFARVIANAYFILFSVILVFFFVFVPDFLGLSSFLVEVSLAAGLFVFLMYWTFFRKRIIYVLKSAEIVAAAEFISGRNVPITRQASFGYNLIKKSFSSISNFRKFEFLPQKVIKKFYGAVGFISFIPNLNSAVFSCILSYVFADPSVDKYTSLRDGLVLFYQKKNSLLFQIFAMQIFSYIIFILSYFVLFMIFNPTILAFSYPFNLMLYFSLFLFVLFFYSSFLSHFLICWQSVFFTETVKNDVPMKKTRALIENYSLEFNEISSKAKVFVPLKSLSARHLLSALEKTKKGSFLDALDGAIKDRETFEKERKGGEALTDLVSKVTEIKTSSKKQKNKKREEKHKKKMQERYKKEREYNKIFNLLLDFLGEELGKKDSYKITSMEKKGKGWTAIVLINGEKFRFALDSEGEVIDFKEIKEI